MSEFRDPSFGPGEFSPENPPSPISRQALADGTLHRLFQQAGRVTEMLSDAERAARLEALLGAHPAGEDLWVFAYGSMLWNPTVHYVESRVVRVPGWRRSFCMGSTVGRGSAEQPGLMMGIEPGDGLEGLAYRLAGATVREEMHLLWQREMVTGSYSAQWLRASCRQNRPIQVVAFVIDPNGPTYEADVPEPEQIARIACAAGLLGSNRDYLLRTRLHLRRHAIHDEYIERLAAGTEQLLKRE